MTKQSVIICDLDGTAALPLARSPYDYSKVMTDEPNDPIRTLLYVMHKHGFPIIYVSGRPGSLQCRKLSLAWLARHSFPRGEILLMRPEGDTRRDNIVKQELYEQHIKPVYNVLLVLDDRDRVVAMWREQGLTCLQVNYGDF